MLELELELWLQVLGSKVSWRMIMVLGVGNWEIGGDRVRFWRGSLECSE